MTEPRIGPCTVAQRPGPTLRVHASHGVWPKPPACGVTRLDRGARHGASPGALQADGLPSQFFLGKRGP